MKKVFAIFFAVIISFSINSIRADSEEDFYIDLVTYFGQQIYKDNSAVLNDEMVFGFLSSDDNFEQYRFVLRELSLTRKWEYENRLWIDLDWDKVKLDISKILDAAEAKQGLLLCENLRAAQVGIDVGLLVASVALFFVSGPAGGAGIQAGKAGIQAGLKMMAPQALKTAATIGGRQYAAFMLRQGAISVIKGVGRFGTGLALTAFKFGSLAAAGGAVWAAGGGNVLGVASGLLDSSLSKDRLNCHFVDTWAQDSQEKCYSICGHGTPTDDMNKFLFKRTLGKNVCVSGEKEDKYAVYEMNDDGSRGSVLILEPQQWTSIKNNISKVADKGKCDWGPNDRDLYTGRFVYDPNTFELITDRMVITDAVRFDD